MRMGALPSVRPVVVQPGCHPGNHSSFSRAVISRGAVVLPGHQGVSARINANAPVAAGESALFGPAMAIGSVVSAIGGADRPVGGLSSAFGLTATSFDTPVIVFLGAVIVRRGPVIARQTPVIVFWRPVSPWQAAKRRWQGAKRYLSGCNGYGSESKRRFQAVFGGERCRST
jgi:hypothetical protein